MNKAILVIDMPKQCMDCPICASWQASAFSNREYWCTASENIDVDPYDKPKWCPLKELPKKAETFDCEELCDVEDWYDSGYAYGWNAYMNKILSGEATND